MSADPYATGAVRAQVLAGWGASAARFREDANAEEDLALGGYRDRVVVELAQNAADAATRAGVPGRLLLRLTDDVLLAANTGAPLDADGVGGLATLRASAKRDESSVGRFGVGFAAVLALTDEPSIGSGTAAVTFSRRRTREAAAALPGLADELAARADHVPALRLPWPGTVPPEPGYATTVLLPLRDRAAHDAAAELLAALDETLLLALPALVEIVVEAPAGRRLLTAARAADRVRTTVDGAARDWVLQERAGATDAALLADRPTEERGRSWSLTWAAAVDDGRVVAAAAARVLHAPTPTDEASSSPALLIASFPLDPTRRHVAPGPLTDHLVAQAGAAYADLAHRLAADGVDPVALVPGPLPRGALDAALARAAREHLRGVPLLPTAHKAAVLLAPARATAIDGATPAAAAAIAEVLDDVTSSGWPGAALDALGVRRLQLADVVDDLAGLAREPAWWHGLYTALAGCDPEELRALPVPLADGRTVRGPRGLLVPGPALDAQELLPLGLRLVHPDAAHPLLERLGAAPATAATVLADPAVAAAVAEGTERADWEEVASAVLALVAQDEARADHDWLGGLLLRDEYGEPTPARDLVLPGSAAAQLLGELPRVDGEAVERWGEDLLVRVGVQRTLGLLRLDDAALDPDELDERDVDQLGDWADAVLDTLPVADLPPVAPELTLVRDLDYVSADAWPQALALLARPPLRAAVVDPVRVVLPEGPAREVVAPAAWWLRRHALLDGHAPGELRLAGADERLTGLWDPVRLDVDAAFLQAVGVRTTLDALLAEPGGADDLLDRIEGTDLPAARLHALHLELGRRRPAVAFDRDRVRVPVGGGTALAAARDVVVATGPFQLQLPWPVVPLTVPAALAAGLAEVLGVDLARGRITGAVDTAGVEVAVAGVVRAALPDAPATWLEHDRLLVGDVEVDWWVTAGVVHAATTEGLAKGLAWAAGRWPARWLVAALLAEPERAALLAADAAFD